MKYVTKQFLNDSVDESGYIICTATSDKYDELSRYHAEHPSAAVQVQLADCSKKIYLDFSVYEDAHVQKRIHKINILINDLEALREQISVVWEQAKEDSTKWLEDNKGVEDDDEMSILEDLIK